jgi:tetratricopeptide (TPR) repeat protein
MNAVRSVLPKTLTPLLVAVLLASCSPEAKKSRLLQRAGHYFESGEADKARIEYLNLLQLDPQNKTAFERLGVICFDQGAPLEALPFLLKARVLSPNDLNTRTKLAIAFLSLGQIREARNEAAWILEQSPTIDEAALILADTARTRQDIGEVEEILKKFSKSDNAYFALASASLAVRKGDLAAAENAIRQALSVNRELPAAHLAMADLLLLRNDVAGAGQEFKTAADLAPPKSTARIEYAEIKERTGDIPGAIAVLKEVVREAPDYLPAWGRLARIAFAEKQYDESLAFLDNIFSRDPISFEGRLLEAQVHLANGDVKNALDGLERLSAAYPNSPLLKYELGRAYLRNNNLAQAATALSQAVLLNPDYAEAVLVLGEVKLRTGDPQTVVASMQRLLQKYPELTPARLLLAEAYRTSGRFDNAVATLREQIQLFPHSAQAQLLLGVVLRQQEKLDEARQAFEEVQKLEPDNLSAVQQLVELDILKADFDSAMQKIRSALEKKPDSADLQFLEARVFAAKGDSDRIESALLKTLKLNPDFAGAHELLVSTYIASNEFNNAAEQLKILLAKDPASLQALMLSGQIYEKLNEFEQAREAYEKLLTNHPNFAPGLNNLAYLYAERFKELDKAYDLASKASAIEPGDAGIADTLGWIFYQKADYPRALRLLQESAEKLPENAEIQFHLGMAHYMMGQTDEARTALRQTLRVQPDFPGRNGIEARLALLGDESGQSPKLSGDELQSILRERPDDIVAWMRLAESDESQGRFREAAEAYEHSLKINPELPSVTKRLAKLNAGPLADSDKAFEFARQARELAPNDPEVAGILGELAYLRGDYPWAYSLLLESSRQLTNDPKILRDLAWAAYSVGKVTLARETMQTLLKTVPTPSQSEDATLFLAMTALEGSDLVAAEPEIEKLLGTDPGYVPALMARAAIQLRSGQIKGPIDIYNQVLKKYPDFAPAQKNLAELYLKEKDHRADAYNLAVKARKALPDDPDLAQIVAEALRKRGTETP